MLNPKDELFAAANSARAEQLAREAVQTDKDAEAKQRQRLVDQKKAADKKESDERAAAFVEIMQTYEIPAVTVYRDIHEIIGYHNFQYEKFGSPEKRPTYKNTTSKFGEGWIIREFRAARPWDYDGNPSAYAAKPGLVLLEDFTTREFNIGDEGTVLSQNIEQGLGGQYTWTDRPPLESPYAGEEGIATLGKLLAKHGVVPEESTLEAQE